MWVRQYAPSPNRSTLVGGLPSVWDIVVVYKTREGQFRKLSYLDGGYNVVGCREKGKCTTASCSHSEMRVKCRRGVNVLGWCRRALHVYCKLR
jgi:hypothetical protein